MKPTHVYYFNRKEKEDDDECKSHPETWGLCSCSRENIKDSACQANTIHTSIDMQVINKTTQIILAQKLRS